jgi:hypothetical protein
LLIQIRQSSIGLWNSALVSREGDMATYSKKLFAPKSVQPSAQSTLIQLTGINFRNCDVHCLHCDWHGRAGELRVPAPGALENAVEYACPCCSKIIARHPGLSTDEVMKEMLRIRQLLSEEMSESLYQASQPDDKAERTADFVKVRAQLRNAEIKESAASDAPAEVIDGSVDELDFEEIRSRLSGIS